MALKNLEEGMLVLCTVKKIVGATVFVNIEEYDKEGTIITSEIAPGRIRNLRDYVVPNKKIVCKILRITNNSIDLSLRRVTEKEKKEVLEDFEKEKKAITILKMIYNGDYNPILKEIKEEYGKLYLLFQKENKEKIIEKFGKEVGGKILSMLNKIKEKKIEVSRKVNICLGEESIEKLKEIFFELPDGISVKYISAPKYQVNAISVDYKDASKKLDNFLEKIKEKAKKENISIEY